MGLEKVEAMCGNWCGPGHPRDSNANPPTTDALDAVCRTHDLCYRRKGFQSCACDQQMTRAVTEGPKQAATQRDRAGDDRLLPKFLLYGRLQDG